MKTIAPTLVAVALAAAALPAEKPPSLSGRWTLNVEQSEDAREKMRDAGGGRRPEGGGMRGGRGGMGGRGGGMGGGGGAGRGGGAGGRGGEGGDMRERLRAALEAPAEMTITHTAAEIAVLEPDGLLRVLHPDGKGYKDAAGDEVKARWDGGRLVVESKNPQGRKRVETWSRDGEESKLIVVTEMELPSGGRFSVRRVYDASSH